MDEARLEQLDAAPLKADLDRVASIKTKAEFARHMASTFSDFGSTLFAAGVLPDPANPTMKGLEVVLARRPQQQTFGAELHPVPSGASRGTA